MKKPPPVSITEASRRRGEAALWMFISAAIAIGLLAFGPDNPPRAWWIAMVVTVLGANLCEFAVIFWGAYISGRVDEAKDAREE